MMKMLQLVLSVLSIFTTVIMQSTNAGAAQHRVALVIGNSSYQHTGALKNPQNDADDLAVSLKALDFQVILGKDLDKAGMDRIIRTFSQQLSSAEEALFFYSGHALQVAGINHLVPIDAKLENERDLDFETVRLEFILQQMELGRTSSTNLVFLDACRDNPFVGNLMRGGGTRSMTVGKGLAQVQAGVGSFISYATQPGNVALDGEGRNSPFTTALIRRIQQEGVPLGLTMMGVRKDVLASTKGKQIPWDHSSLIGDFFFKPGSPKATSLKCKAGASRFSSQIDNQQLLLKADQMTYDYTRKRISAIGGVDLYKGKLSVSTEMVDYDEATCTMSASGGVVVREPSGAVFQADEALVSEERGHEGDTYCKGETCNPGWRNNLPVTEGSTG